ncbi:Lipase (class 3) [Caballeronia arationis]|uniref:Lipase (Class 3) n=1 Tax=Caballeronia arationis TaxID=1777142 RepID=A0A7Z7ICF4_9BURK|nr:lipase family protein [Caballeronia arationis]SOE87994.1 Lipase (class 3) [Caballeronia arationis]
MPQVCNARLIRYHLAIAAIASASIVCSYAQSPEAFVKDNLPSANAFFRNEQIRAVQQDIVVASAASVATYFDASDQRLEKLGWVRYEVPRNRVISGAAVSVFLIRIDDSQKKIEIAIRGTDNFDDALRDLQIAAIPDKVLNFPLHAGFQSIATGIFDKIKTLISDEQLKTYKFYLYGHSLGGAAAAILSMYLFQGGSEIGLVVTFGAPRFTVNEGTRKYQLLNLKTFRIVRCDDVIPFLPPPNFFGWSTGGYEANGNIVLLLRPPYFDYSIGIDIERDFTHQLRLELANGANHDKLAYGHRMKNYDLSIFRISPKVMALYTGGSLKPISYTMELQTKLCPARMGHDEPEQTQVNKSKQ